MSRRRQNASNSIPLEYANTTRPTEKTLVQQALEREAELARASSFSDSAATDDTSPHIAAILTTILYVPTLTLLHYTFHLLVLHQYSQLGEALTSASTSSSKLLVSILLDIVRRYAALYAVVVYLAHTPLLPFARYPRIRQILFFLAASLTGCSLVRMTHSAPYLQMVENAPAVGTLWVWCTLEMGIETALGMVMVVVGYAWWAGYGFR